MRILFVLESAILETRAEDWYDSFATPFKWTACLLAVAFIGAAFNENTRLIVWGPFIAVSKVSAPLTGVMATCFLSCIGIALLLLTVESYVDSYTSDYKVVSGDGQTYAEPSFRAKPCGVPRAIGKNLDCAGSASCDTVDNVGGRWVKVVRKNPTPMDCWINYRHAEFQRGWFRAHLPFKGTTGEEQAEARVKGAVAFTQSVEAAMAAKDRAKLDELGQEGVAEKVALPPEDADAIEQAMSELKFEKLVAEAKTSGSAVILRQAIALPYPKEKNDVAQLLEQWYLDRRAALKDKLNVASPAYEPGESVTLALATSALLGTKKSEAGIASTLPTLDCTGLVERAKIDLLETSKRSPSLAIAALERLEGDGKAFVDACHAGEAIAAVKKPLRAAYIAGLAARLRRLVLNLDAAFPVACEADKYAGDGVVVPAPNLQTLTKSVEATALTKIKLAFTAPPKVTPAKLWKASEAFDAWRAKVEATIGKAATVGKSSVKVGECGQVVDVSGDLTVGGKPGGTFRGKLKREGNDYVFAEAPEVSK